MKKRVYLLIFLITGLFFLMLDQWLKWQSLHNWSQAQLLNKFLGWQPHLNPGIAFGLPLPNWITVLFTLTVLVILIYFIKTRILKTIGCELLAVNLVIIGALSNLIDRLIYQHTVDYLLILTGIINLADALIVIGFLLFFLQNYNRNQQK